MAMRLESQIVIHRTPEEVGRFLGDIGNVSKWDRGVAGVQQISPDGPGVGFEFDTLTKAGLKDANADRGKMSYRISEVGSDFCTVALTNSTGNARFFKRAEWRFQLLPAREGTLLTCSVDFALRWQYALLGPVLYAKRSAIQMDLESLKRAAESAPAG
jgi:carbon monoxide dehydrogenase subunit G